MIPAPQKYANPRPPVALLKSILFILLFIALLMVSGFTRMLLPPAYSMLVYGILGTSAGLLTVWIALRVEKQPFASIGLVWEKKTMPRFLTGVFIGSAIFAVIITTLLSFTNLTLRYQPAAVNQQFILLYLAVLPLALMEEIGFRSYPQIKLNNAYGVWTSQIVVAIAFGAYHILNGWSPFVAFTGPFVWAFVFGLTALKSGGIAMSTGIHFAVNVLQNAVGLKSGKGTIFKLDYPPGTTKALMASTEKTGSMLQAVILIGALLLTALYVKSKKEQAK
jgi:membrane protease YdiL (CAAX protease family)